MKKLSYILYICAVAVCTGCSEYPEPTSIAPKMNTGEVTDIYRFGATIKGTFTEDQKSIGPVEESGILLSIMQSMAEPDTLKASMVESGETFEVKVDGLKAGTKYYYQSYAFSGVSFAKGEVKEFETVTQNAPVFEDYADISYDYKSIDLAVRLKDEGGSIINTKGFCWKVEGESEGDPTNKDNVRNIAAESSDFSGRIFDLLPNKTYLVRAYAINSEGPGYGTTFRVHTNETDRPSMSSIKVVEQTASSIHVQSKVLSKGTSEILEKGFCWSTEPNPTIDGFHKAVAGTDEIEEVITALRPNIIYYIRAYATNSSGTEYGDEYATMVSQTSPPVLSAVKVEDYTGSSIVVSATILSDGGEEILEKGFCYSDLVMPTIDGPKVVVEEAGEKITATITNLMPSTAYVIRAYARNGRGAAYSVSICVETLDETHLVPNINGWDDKPAEDGNLK